MCVTTMDAPYGSNYFRDTTAECVQIGYVNVRGYLICQPIHLPKMFRSLHLLLACSTVCYFTVFMRAFVTSLYACLQCRLHSWMI